MGAKVIYLVRHGEIEGSEEKRYVSLSDVGLSEDGFVQAKALRDFFKGVDIDCAYCSTLARSIQTAETIMEGRLPRPVRIRELSEIDMGEWSGKSFSDIKREFPEDFERRIDEIDTFKPAGGESFLECQTRAMQAFERIAGTGCESTLIVAHAGVNRAIISGLLKMPLKDIFKIGQDYGCINKISVQGNLFTVDYVNMVLQREGQI